MKWILAESAKPQPGLPWQRGKRIDRATALPPVKLRPAVRALERT